jgi:hypothetical protein
MKPMLDATIRRLGVPLRSHTDALGSVAVWRPASRILVTRVIGHLNEEGAREIDVAFQKQIVEEGLHVGFHDWGAMTDYDSQARIFLTQTTQRSLERIEAVHFLVQSRVVTFGIRAANLILKRLTVHEEPGTFDRELQRWMSK